MSLTNDPGKASPGADLGLRIAPQRMPGSYLPGRMLPMLLGRFRDDVAEALGVALPPLPQRPGSVKVAQLGDLTSGELDPLSGAVLNLLTRFTVLMDDPLLPKLLGEFQDALVIEKADRARIADELREKARAS